MKITDFIEIKDYYKKAGQSGKLGVAIDSAGKKYLLKQGHYGEPANEYVYSLVSKKVGVSCQTCHLVEGFGVPVVALEYISPMNDSEKKKFNYKLIIDDLVKAITLDALTWQDDNLQYIIGEDGRFYKIDNSEAFGFSGYERCIFESNQDEFIKKRLSQIESDVERILIDIKICKERVVEEYGEQQVHNMETLIEKFSTTDYSFLKEDKQLQTVYSKETYKYFLARITAINNAIFYLKKNKIL